MTRLLEMLLKLLWEKKVLVQHIQLQKIVYVMVQEQFQKVRLCLKVSEQVMLFKFYHHLLLSSEIRLIERVAQIMVSYE